LEGKTLNMKVENYLALMGEALAERDEQKFYALLYEATSKKTLAYAKSLVSSFRREHIIEAEDLVQETFLNIMDSNLNNFKVERLDTIDRYVVRCVKNVFLNNIEKSGHKDDSRFDYDEIPPQYQSPFDAESAVDYADLNSRLLARLSVVQRQIFTKDLEGYKLQEIADDLGLGLSNVKYHLGEAKSKLKSGFKIKNPEISPP
jgi:RNA polymerase sigma factor (sigma-70 family)